MLLKFATAASVFTFAAVHSQGAILDTDSEDFKKTLNQSYSAFDSPEGEVESTIGTCLYGETEQEPALTDFDGEFEGLAPRNDYRSLYKYGHG